MRAKSISILGILAAVTLVWSVGALSILYSQQVWAPRSCGGCVEFKKLTHEFEKVVIDAAVIDPNSIPGLLERYSQAVLRLFTGPE
jgi:hypothetical protein